MSLHFHIAHFSYKNKTNIYQFRQLNKKSLHTYVTSNVHSPILRQPRSQSLPLALQTLTYSYRRISEPSLRLLLRGRVESAVLIGSTAHPGDSKKYEHPTPYEHPPNTPCAILKNFVTCSHKSICVYASGRELDL